MDPVRWKRIQDIFYEASELDAPVRSAYLDEACAGDEPLRAEVDGFLRSLENGPDDPLADAIGAEAASLLGSNADSGEGRIIGAYQLVRKIGQGGMGAVYLAERADRQFDREVAIKLAPADVAGSAGRLLRFRMERQILANLDHPNIAGLLDGGITEDGVPYLVMEYVEGRPIDEYCRTNALTVRERIGLFVTVCAAVRYAHHNLVIHRDIKPSNILVTAAGVPKLLDFGIAKLMAPGAAGLTLPAERLMTLEYAAPEQMRGSPVTTATDVYALGIVLWELLTSKRLFDSARPGTEPPRPSSISAAPEESREIRGDLDNIVAMALRKEPGARYGSVEQLEDDLRRYLDGFPVLASRGSRMYKAVKFVRRHGAAVAAATVALGMLVGFAVAMSALAARAARERDAAREQRARAEQISQFLTSLFASSDPFHARANGVTAKDLLDHGARRIANDLAGQPRVQAALLETMAVAYQHLGLEAESEDLFRQQASAEERGSGPQSIGVARALRQLGDVERERTRLSDAERDLRRALAIVQGVPAEEMELAHTVNDLGLVLQGRGQVPEARKLFEQAVTVSSRHPGEIAETLVMMSNLGGALADLGDFDAAEKEQREVLARRRQLLGPAHPQVLHSMLRLGSLLDRRGKIGEAESLYRQALAADRKLLGEKHPDTIALTNNLGTVLQEKGDLVEAEGLYRTAIRLEAESLGENADLALYRSNLAGLLSDELRFAEAAPLLEGSIALCRSKLGAGSLREAHMLEKDGVLEKRLRRWRDAERDFDAALAIRRAKLGEQHPEIAASYFDAAELRREQNRWEEAEVLYRRALDIDRRAFPFGHLQTAAHQLGYANMLATAGRANEAEELAREALAWRTKALPAGSWQIAAARGMVGAAELTANPSAEAEALVIESFSALKAQLGIHAEATQEALARVLVMYRTSANNAEEAAYRRWIVKW